MLPQFPDAERDRAPAPIALFGVYLVLGLLRVDRTGPNLLILQSIPNGIRTRVAALKGVQPGLPRTLADLHKRIFIRGLDQRSPLLTAAVRARILGKTWARRG